MLNMKEKIVLITGGSGWLGTAMCEALAEFGATLIIGSRNYEKNLRLSEELRKKFKNSNYPQKLDVSNSENIKENMSEIIDKFGKIDVLINNAMYLAGKKFTLMTDEEWYKGLDGCINTVYRCTREVLPYMLNKKSGKIINISSMYGIVSPDVSIYDNNDFYNPANYGTGKAAIIQFTRYIAAVYGKSGINSNSISPGPFPNERVKKDKEFVKKLENKVPLKRIGHPDDLKGIILLLASDASNYINGANFVVDGGWTIW